MISVAFQTATGPFQLIVSDGIWASKNHPSQ